MKTSLTKLIGVGHFFHLTLIYLYDIGPRLISLHFLLDNIWENLHIIILQLMKFFYLNTPIVTTEMKKQNIMVASKRICLFLNLI